MIQSFVFKSFLLLLYIACCAKVAGAPFLVEGGEPAAEIVVAAEPSRMARYAAAELQGYVKKMTGAEVPVVTEPTPGSARLYIGVSPQTRELGLDTSGLEHGAYRIASGGDWAALLGRDGEYTPVEPWGRSRGKSGVEKVYAEWEEITGEPFANPFGWHYMYYYPEADIWTFDDAGTLNAVYAFLRELGVRWYAPGAQGEVVPNLDTIELPRGNEVVEPDFPLRNLTYYYGQHGLGDVGLWNLRLGFNPGGDLLGHVMQGHGSKWVMMRPEMREAHPEFYALYEGERDDMAPCLSSPGLFDMHVKYIRAMFDHYGETVVNIDMPDGYGRGICQCELCAGLDTPERGRDGSMSDYVWGYLDRVAREVYESHPDRKVNALAYSTYRQPPLDIDQMSPNLVLTECRTRSHLHDPATRERTRELRQEWLAKLPSGEYTVWDYYLNARPGERGLPIYFPTLIGDELRELRGVSLGDKIEVYKDQDFIDYRPREPRNDYDAFAVNHLNLYITSRLWWDADLDVAALLDEYCELYYGPAAKQMREFIAYSEANWPHMRRSPEAIDGAIERIAAAQAAVDAESIYGQRVAAVANYVEPLHDLRRRLERVSVDVPKARVLPVAALGAKELDGRVDDPQFWPEVRQLPLRNVKNRDSLPNDLWSWVRIFKADDAIYFGFHCSEPDTESAVEDYVEVYLETTSGAHYAIRVDKQGRIDDIDLTDQEPQPLWDSGAEAVVYQGEGYWSVELRIPLAGDGTRALEPLSGVDGRMPSATYPWYFNAGRVYRADDVTVRGAFSTTGEDNLCVPSHYAEMWSK